MLDYNLIQDAAQRLKKRVRRTELIHAQHFSERLGFPVYFKCENLQRTGAFKIRGALNFMTSPAPATFGRDQNRYDTTQHEFLFADALRVEYRAITGAGFILQIDDPGMAENRCVARPAGRLDHLRS